jgi:hypothetical protein
MKCLSLIHRARQSLEISRKTKTPAAEAPGAIRHDHFANNRSAKHNQASGSASLFILVRVYTVIAA